MFISKLNRYTTSLSYSECRHFSGNREPISISLHDKEEACGSSIIVITLGRNRLGLGIRACSETRWQLVGTGRRNNWQNRKLRDHIVNSRLSRCCPWFLRPAPTNCPWVSEDGMTKAYLESSALEFKSRSEQWRDVFRKLCCLRFNSLVALENSQLVCFLFVGILFL